MNFLRHRFNYLINYIWIGFFSIVFESLIIQLVLFQITPFWLKVFLGFLSGLFLSLILNAKLNFKVPRSKNVRVFLLFSLISIMAFSINLILIGLIKNVTPLDYTFLRFFTAAIVFAFSYLAHRRFTFDFIKKVGIAIYLNKGQNIIEIYSKIRYYSDFIHIDLLDETFSPGVKELDLNLIEEIDKTWGLKKMVHIMSKKPSIWIKRLINKGDVFLFHLEIEEDIEKIISLCKKNKKAVGIVLSMGDSVEDILKYLPQIDFVQVMGINSLGKSGEELNISSLKKVDELNRLKEKYSFEIIFDGGVRTTNVHKINSKYIVSSSSLLSSKNPIDSFMQLKTGLKNNTLDKFLKQNILLGIKKTVESMDFIESASVVGSFLEGREMSEINDIDIIIILDKLSRQKFEVVLDKFECLKKEVESKYACPVFINNTLGPIKLDKKGIVFHLMIYDKETHKAHCINSPFTCFDWQRSPFFFNKPMSEIYKVWDLKLTDFFNSRRSFEEYIKDLKNEKIPYRVYVLRGNKVVEEQRYKEMNSRDKIEFSYHVINFLVINFLKFYYNENKKRAFEVSIKKYFEIFPENKKSHIKLIEEIIKLKKEKKGKIPNNFLISTQNFVKDFEYQFKKMFEIK